MKNDIHPTWYNACKVTCSCGKTFTVGSTKDSMQVDICLYCHPFFTGEARFVDRQGRVEGFIKKVQSAQAKQAVLAKKKKKNTGPAKSYQEILREQQQVLRQQTQATRDNTPIAPLPRPVAKKVATA